MSSAPSYLLGTGPDRRGIDLARAERSIPLSETRALLQSMPPTTPDNPRLVNDADLPRAMAMNRIRNAICNWCWKKGDTPLFYCRDCHCTWYCSESCQQLDDSHRAWCCQPDATPDCGPQAVAILPYDAATQTVDAAKQTLPTPTVVITQETIRARQTVSNAAIQAQFKDLGNTAYKATHYEQALAYYTRGIRLPGLMTDLRKVRRG
jgi:hypothetical protein